jgi:hypothetical protein
VLETLTEWQPYLEKAQAQPTHPRVALLIDTEPVAVAGGWLAELVEHLGGVLCEVTDSPEVLIVAIPSFTLEEAHFAAQPLYTLPEWIDLPCVQSGDCYVTDSVRFFDTPTSESAQILATILYPEVFSDILPPYSVRLLEKEPEASIDEEATLL